MIEVMLEAERAMGLGLIDNAERLFRQVATVDPKNSIAVTGLARVALERGDQLGAYMHARQALKLDPENPVASHLARRMEEQLRMHGEAVPGDPAVPPPARGPVPEPPGPAGAPAAGAPAAGAPDATVGAAELAAGPLDSAVRPRPNLVDRLLRRRR